jgi:hypothetical protein
MKTGRHALGLASLQRGQRDEQRNHLIFDDVLKALEAKRSPIVLTERWIISNIFRAVFRASYAILSSFEAECQQPNARRQMPPSEWQTIRNGSSLRQGVTSARALMTQDWTRGP